MGMSHDATLAASRLRRGLLCCGAMMQRASQAAGEAGVRRLGFGRACRDSVRRYRWKGFVAMRVCLDRHLIRAKLSKFRHPRACPEDLLPVWEVMRMRGPVTDMQPIERATVDPRDKPEDDGRGGIGRL